MKILFDNNAAKNSSVQKNVSTFLSKINTLEKTHDIPIVIFQDGVIGAYYIKCSILATDASKLSDLSARLDLKSTESYRANRELLLKHETYLKMEVDSQKGREFNDIIVEYNTDYNDCTPLKVWGGQHRISAISNAGTSSNRHHGFRIYFNLSKEQRTEVALISNTNISVSNDTFDRMIEETIFGNVLRDWCQKAGFLKDKEDFPDVGSKSEKITVKKARSFIVNYYLGKQKGSSLNADDLDKNYYAPYLTKTGVTIDEIYKKIMGNNNILKDKKLIEAGKHYLALHEAQNKAIRNSKVINKKAYRSKAFVESVLTGWSFISGLLQEHPERLNNHYLIPKTNSKVTDPLNAEEMSTYKHDSDAATYRGLGTRSSPKDRQRMAQLFLAKSFEKNVVIDKKFMNKAVSQVVGLTTLSKGYA